MINYRDYRKFLNEEFRAQLDYEISKHDINNMEYQHFLNIFIEVLNKHASMEQKYLRANQGRFMTKNLYNVLDLEISFSAIGKKCLEKNTKNINTFA